MKYGPVVLTAGLTGLLSFSLLAVAIGTDYWYIIDVNKPNYTGPDDLSSHSGLWTINEGANSSVISSFAANMSGLSETERHLLGLHKVVVIVLPLSLILLVLGWILGLVSSLACSPKLLAASGSYFLCCSVIIITNEPSVLLRVLPPSRYQKACQRNQGVFTLTGISIYIRYSNQAMEEFQRVVPPENLIYVHVSFGWSLATAWLSYSLEVATGLLLMLAGRIVQIKGHYDSGVAITML